MSAPKAIKLKDYKPTTYIIDSVNLTVEIFDDHAKVTNTLKIKQRDGTTGALVLNGEDQELISVAIDGQALSSDEYQLTEDTLVIEKPGSEFELVITSKHNPSTNKSFMGLYMSQGNYFTQCEAEGFRRITYYYDRPDCMSVFTTRVEGDKSKLPVLLSNGNKTDSGDLEGGRHFVTFHDPFPKPAYLFALVAADLPKICDTYTTGSGRKVDLEIYARKNDIEKCHFAMDSLKRSMKWDEDFYGLECDLDAFKIVAVSDFNFGAMENKGLNIFNTSAVLASPETTTDATFIRVEGVVAHEYFHNWSGNRVTCQSWFQLCLKEGLTVFRDQEFTSTMHSRGVNRIENAKFLKEHQFAEDAGPLAHPPRPDEYIQIDNFYTLTIYEKGSEICRMIHTLLGAENYRKGVDCYFSRHDGQAVTVEDFVKAMSDGSGVDLSSMMNWYTNPGTPAVEAAGEYNAEDKTFSLYLKQNNPKAPDAPAFKMPVNMGLVGASGKQMPLTIDGKNVGTDTTLVFDQKQQKFDFTNVDEEVVPSLFRGFSAPVKLNCGYSEDNLLHLMSNDSDEFNRYQATQELFMSHLLKMVKAKSVEVDERLVAAFTSVLEGAQKDPAVTALTIQLPSEAQISQEMEIVDVESIYAARKAMRTSFANANRKLLESTYKSCQGTDPKSISTDNVGRRSLMNTCLSYLACDDDKFAENLVKAQFDGARNMTEERAAFTLLVNSNSPHREQAITAHYDRWQDEDLVINAWFGALSGENKPGSIKRVKKLLDHPAFNFSNPNRLRALVGGFVGSKINFHAADGSGYEFLADVILKIDKLNAQTAARLSSGFATWKKYPAARQELMKKQLERIVQTKGISKGTYEMVSKSLG